RTLRPAPVGTPGDRRKKMKVRSNRPSGLSFRTRQDGVALRAAQSDDRTFPKRVAGPRGNPEGPEAIGVVGVSPRKQLSGVGYGAKPHHNEAHQEKIDALSRKTVPSRITMMPLVTAALRHSRPLVTVMLFCGSLLALSAPAPGCKEEGIG